MNQNTGIPMIRLELEGMKQSIIHAFNNLQIQQDAAVRAAVENFCKPEHLNQLINAAVNDVLTHAIKDEVNNFYRYGAGRDFIKELVKKRLDEGSTELG